MGRSPLSLHVVSPWRSSQLRSWLPQERVIWESYQHGNLSVSHHLISEVYAITSALSMPGQCGRKLLRDINIKKHTSLETMIYIPQPDFCDVSIFHIAQEYKITHPLPNPLKTGPIQSTILFFKLCQDGDKVPSVSAQVLMRLIQCSFSQSVNWRGELSAPPHL